MGSGGHEASGDGPHAGPIRVLLADDHAVVRDGLRMVLETLGGITVVGQAADGRTAVDLAQRLCPDVVLMDISMPELNGIEATRKIRESRPAVRVIMLSMHATSEHVYHAFQAGAHGYVLKESASREVIDAIRAVKLGRRYISQNISDSMISAFMIARGGDLAARSPLEQLSAREKQILQRVAEGQSSAEIARSLRLSPKTVETYRARMMQKLDIHDLPSLVKFAIRFGLTSAD